LRGWRTLSLQARQLAAASLALVAFLGFTGYALDRAFVETAQNALRERLSDLANGYLSGSELDRGRAFISPEPPPDIRFMIVPFKAPFEPADWGQHGQRIVSSRVAKVDVLPERQPATPAPSSSAPPPPRR
jgi:hypothetical protein